MESYGIWSLLPPVAALTLALWKKQIYPALLFGVWMGWLVLEGWNPVSAVASTIGAIIAGIFLGTLSLWTRSIWLGVLIHVTVAVAMDLAALSYRGELDQLFGIVSTKPM